MDSDAVSPRAECVSTESRGNALDLDSRAPEERNCSPRALAPEVHNKSIAQDLAKHFLDWS
jgi:hypothetical protein